MSTVSRTAIANGTNEVERKAASDANAVQDGVNIVAIVGAFHRASARLEKQRRFRRQPHQSSRGHRFREQAHRPLSLDRRA